MVSRTHDNEIVNPDLVLVTYLECEIAQAPTHMVEERLFDDDTGVPATAAIRRAPNRSPRAPA